MYGYDHTLKSTHHRHRSSHKQALHNTARVNERKDFVLLDFQLEFEARTNSHASLGTPIQVYSYNRSSLRSPGCVSTIDHEVGA